VQGCLQSWSLVIFCYNEAGTIEKVVTDAKLVMDEIAPGMHEIIIVDDGSSDGSTEKIREIEKNVQNVKTVFHASNRGIGNALRSGYAQAANENVCAIPADGQFNVKELLPFRRLDEKTFISFYRVENTTYSNFRKGLSYLNKTLNQIFLQVHLRDVNWVKVYKSKELKQLRLGLQSSLIESEICAKLVLRGNNPIQVRSAYLRRSYGKSKGASSTTILRAAKETWKLIVQIRKFAKRKVAECDHSIPNVDGVDHRSTNHRNPTLL
jgi:glycosyltransferase involved in cell wall biosynthesis